MNINIPIINVFVNQKNSPMLSIGVNELLLYLSFSRQIPEESGQAGQARPSPHVVNGDRVTSGGPPMRESRVSCETCPRLVATAKKFICISMT